MKSFVAFALILITTWLGAASASAAAERRLIAVIIANSSPRYQDIQAVFVDNSKGFCDAGCRIYVQTPNEDVLSLRNSVRKAVALDADLIITYGAAAALAAKLEDPGIPTLFADVVEPVRLELVSQQSQTGRNMTGVRGDAPVQALFKYLLESAGTGKLAVVYDANCPEGLQQKNVLEESAAKKGVVVVSMTVENPNGTAATFKSLAMDIDGIFLASCEHAGAYLGPVLELAGSRRVPVITLLNGAAEMGAFMVLETSASEQGEKLAEMAGQVLASRSTKDLPMVIPHQVAFVINMKVAKEYGIQVPIQILSIASRLIR